jgi:hypothetical protein
MMFPDVDTRREHYVIDKLTTAEIITLIVGGLTVLAAGVGAGVALQVARSSPDDNARNNGDPVAVETVTEVVTETITETATEFVADDTPPNDSEGSEAQPQTRRVDLPLGTYWDVDNWEESEDFDTRDLRLSSGRITFREVAEAGADWTLADCQDPELRAWSDENETVDVDAEHRDFCLRTTQGMVALVRVEKEPSFEQTVRTYELSITTPQ